MSGVRFFFLLNRKRSIFFPSFSPFPCLHKWTIHLPQRFIVGRSDTGGTASFAPVALKLFFCKCIFLPEQTSEETSSSFLTDLPYSAPVAYLLGVFSFEREPSSVLALAGTLPFPLAGWDISVPFPPVLLGSLKEIVETFPSVAQ